MKEQDIKEIREFMENKGYHNIEVLWNLPLGSTDIELKIEASRKTTPIVKDETGRLSKETENNPNDVVDAFIYAMTPILEKVQKSLAGHPYEQLALTKEFEEMVMNIQQAKVTLVNPQYFMSSKKLWIDDSSDMYLHKDKVCELLDKLLPTKDLPGINYCVEGITAPVIEKFKIDNGLTYTLTDTGDFSKEPTTEDKVDEMWRYFLTIKK